MNIKLYTGSKDFSDYTPAVSAASQPKEAVGSKTGNYDRISLQATSRSMSDSSFARVLAREAASKLGDGVSRERVFALKQQVESGTYVPDSRRIAERMLGYR